MKWFLLLFPLTLFASFEADVTDAAPSEEIRSLWCELTEKGYIERSGDDADIRPLFVTLQGIVEQQLAENLGGSVRRAASIIHTPMPTTPLCTKGKISPDLIDPSIEKDPKRLETVKLRTTTLRDFLYKGGELTVAYPKGGLEKRSKEQQEIYREELECYSSLRDLPLNCESMPGDLVGATYFFNECGTAYFFSIKITQANAPGGENFGLWFGTYDNPLVVERFKRVCIFIGDHE